MEPRITASYLPLEKSEIIEERALHGLLSSYTDLLTAVLESVHAVSNTEMQAHPTINTLIVESRLSPLFIYLLKEDNVAFYLRAITHVLSSVPQQTFVQKALSLACRVVEGVALLIACQKTKRINEVSVSRSVIQSLGEFFRAGLNILYTIDKIPALSVRILFILIISLLFLAFLFVLFLFTVAGN